MKSLYLTLPICLGLVACQPGPEPSQHTPAAVVHEGRSETMKPANPESMEDAAISLSVERDELQSAITVRLTKSSDSFKILSLERQNMITGEKAEIYIQSSDIVDRIPSPRNDLRPWHFKYIAQTDRGQVTGVVRVLKDLQLSSQSRLSEFEFDSNRIELRNLDLRPSGGLITEGRNVQIDAATLQLGAGSLIQSFDSFDVDKVEGINKPGKSGGKLIMNIGWATGPLEIVMSGRVGAPGEKGANASQDRPPQAARGRDAEETPGFPAGPDYPGERPSCHRNATDGQAGVAGADGAPGFDGRPGGDSGSVQLNVKSGERFTYRVTLKAGVGGKEGPGGKGQPGGLGGDPGSSSVLCRHQAKQGAQGADGKDGKYGRRGLDGVLGEVCITLAATATSCVSQSQVLGGF